MSYSNPIEQRIYQNQWIAKRRAKWISSNGPCSCGSEDRLQVDHVDPSTKSMDPALIWGCREEVREAELAKCQVLCFECHLKKSRTENSILKQGVGNPASKITEDDVRAIRDSSEPRSTLASRYGLHPQQIHKIRTRQRWKHVI